MEPVLAAGHVLVHIGHSKTGSSLLQQHVFPRLPDCDFVGPGPADSSERAVFDSLLYGRGDDDHALGVMSDPTRPKTLEVYDPARVVRGVAALVGGAPTLLISREGFSGDPDSWGRNRVRNARRLEALFPDAHILVVVRDQRTMLRSLYSQYVARGGTRSFSDFLRGAPGGDAFDPDYLCYNRLVTDYRERFGGRVTVVAFERLASDPGASLDLIADLARARLAPELRDELVGVMGAERSNRSLSGASRVLLRATNRTLFKSRFNPRPLVDHPSGRERIHRSLKRLDARVPSLTPDLGPRQRRHLEAVIRRYEADNAELAASTGLPLADLGYPMPSASGEADRSRTARPRRPV